MAIQWNSRFLYKEPVSILRILQLPLILIVLASILAYRADLSDQVSCSDQGHKVTLTQRWKFPFNLRNRTVSKHPCIKSSSDLVVVFDQDYSAFSIPIVTVSCFGVVYTVASLIVYGIWWHTYTNKFTTTNGATIDLCLNFLMLLLWTGSSIAWLIGMVWLYGDTKISSVKGRLAAVDPCGRTDSGGIPSFDDDKCSLSYSWNFGSLFASPVAGFLTAVLHLMCLWHIYLETPRGKPSNSGYKSTKFKPKEHLSENYRPSSGAWPAY